MNREVEYDQLTGKGGRGIEGQEINDEEKGEEREALELGMGGNEFVSAVHCAHKNVPFTVCAATSSVSFGQ